jgi:hypothetical protein
VNNNLKTNSTPTLDRWHYKPKALLPPLTVLTMLVFSIGLYSCSSGTQLGLNAFSDTSKISDITQKQDNSTIYLQGKVEKLAPLLQKSQLYQINDFTGKIWVLSKQNNVQNQSYIKIKGKIRYRSIPLGGKDLGEIYIEELEQIEYKQSK